MRISSNLELLGLYSNVNQKILDEAPGGEEHSDSFKYISALLKETVEVLDKIEVKILFNHPFFPSGKFVSFWQYYNRIMKESLDKTSGPLIKRFFTK